MIIPQNMLHYLEVWSYFTNNNVTWVSKYIVMHKACTEMCWFLAQSLFIICCQNTTVVSVLQNTLCLALITDLERGWIQIKLYGIGLE